MKNQLTARLSVLNRKIEDLEEMTTDTFSYCFDERDEDVLNDELDSLLDERDEVSAELKHWQ